MIQRVTMEVEIPVDVRNLASAFAQLDDDAQAQFLCMAAAAMGGSMALYQQAFAIGRHLRTCTCSTDEGRAFVRAIVEGLDEAP